MTRHDRSVSISICVTAYNERNNLPALIELFATVRARVPNAEQLWVVDNGSTDGSELYYASANTPRTHFVRIEPNRRYGGGMAEAVRIAATDIVCILPGDNQYSADDIISVIEAYLSLAGDQPVMTKGRRATRDDPLQVRGLSLIYSALGMLLLGIGRIDSNGLPKVFDRRVVLPHLDKLPWDAVFDAALCAVWVRSGGTIVELPVTFRNRAHGAPSWSGGKFAVGWAMFKSLNSFRRTLRAMKVDNGGL